MRLKRTPICWMHSEQAWTVDPEEFLRESIRYLSGLHFPLHDLTQGAIDSGLITLAILLEPCNHVRIQTQRDGLLQWTVEVGNLHGVQWNGHALGPFRQTHDVHGLAGPPAPSCCRSLSGRFALCNLLSPFHLSMYAPQCAYNIVPETVPEGTLWENCLDRP